MYPDTKKEETRGNLRSFCHNTSIPGVLHITNGNEKKVLRFLWAAVVLSALAGLVLHATALFKQYFKYKTTKYYSEDDTGFYFPDVHFCNLNGISFSNLREAALKYPELGKHPSFQQMLTNNISVDQDVLKPSVLFHALGDKAKEIGHKLKDMVIACTFGSRPCKEEDFELFHLDRYFNCFTFLKGREHKTVTQSVYAGLSLTMFLESSPVDLPYVDRATENSDGFTFVLREAKANPAINVEGQEVSPGHSISMIFSQERTKHLSDPFPPCNDSSPVHENQKYSYRECMNICIHEKVVQQCGCYPTDFFTRINYTELETPNCARFWFTNNIKAREMLMCQDTTLFVVLNDIEGCKCYSACEEMSYPLSVSQSEWPSENSIKSFPDYIFKDRENVENLKAYVSYNNLLENNASQETINTWIRRHFVRVNIFTNSRKILVKEDVPLISLPDLLCNIGGCMGLWLGISLVTSAEIMELIVRLLYEVCKPRKIVAMTQSLPVNAGMVVNSNAK